MNLSVIIPNYNNERYLVQCIESVLKQTYKPFEIIISDDCSTDRSINIIKEYEKKYSFIKGIYSTENRGVALTRHKAIMEAKGDYITMLDSDDIFYNERKLENEMNLIKKYKYKYNTDIIAYSKTVLIDKKGIKKAEDSKYYFMEGNITFLLLTRLKSRYIPRDFCFTKKMYIDINGYDLKHNLYEDWDLDIRLSACNKYYSTKQDGTGYRQHDTGLSSQDRNKHMTALKMLFEKNIKILPWWKREVCKLIFRFKNRF